MPRPKRPEPTDNERKLVQAHIAAGGEVEQIAEALGISESTARKIFAKEIGSGKCLVTAQIADTLYGRAVKGDTIACIFWLKARAGWRDSGPVAIEQTRIPDFIVAPRSATEQAKREE